MAIHITCSVIDLERLIPKKYRFNAEGKYPEHQNVSIPLSWTGIPEGTKSIAIIFVDADARGGEWTHWVLYDLPPDVTSLPEGLPIEEKLPNGALQGFNDYPEIGYIGPCPPKGVHKYNLELFALRMKLNIPSGATRRELLMAMEGWILEKGHLMIKCESH